MKRSKHTYLPSFFQNHTTDLKNTLKGIKRISLKDSTCTVPSTIIEHKITLTNPKYIADVFNNYFCNVAAGIKSSIKYSRNKFFVFLHQIDINSFFISPTDKTEIKNIILSLDPLKLLLQTVSQQKSWSYWVMIYQLKLLSFSTFLFLKVFSHQY